MAFSYGDADTNALMISQQNNKFNASEAQKQRSFQAVQSQLQNQFNAVEAGKNRDWQMMMSDTAHQREIRDLQAAGLNPVLSATGGNGASVTSGATASSGGLPSGAKAEADTSANSALAAIYGATLSYQAQLESMKTSARTAVAVAREQASASRYASDRSSMAAMYNAALNAATQRGISARQIESQMNLAQYDFDKQMAYRGFDRSTQQQILDQQQSYNRYMTETYPNNMFQAAGALGVKYRDAANSYYDQIVQNGTWYAPLTKIIALMRKRKNKF